MTMRPFVVTTLHQPCIYLGEYFARDRSHAKAQASQLTGMSVFELRAYLCKEAARCM